MSDPSYRLLQIFNRPLGGGGEELATQEIARILSKAPGFAEAIFQSAEWTGPQAPPRWKQAALTFYNPQAIRRLREAQEKTDAQAWILHNYIPVVSGGVFREARRQQVPILQYIHNFRPFSVSSYLWTGRRLDPAHWPANFVREISYGAWQDSRSKTAFLASFLATLHLTRQFRAIKAWVAVSKFMREKFISAGVAPESIFSRGRLLPVSRPPHRGKGGEGGGERMEFVAPTAAKQTAAPHYRRRWTAHGLGEGGGGGKSAD